MECLLIIKQLTFLCYYAFFVCCLRLPNSMPLSSNSCSCFKKPSFGSTHTLRFLTNSKAYTNVSIALRTYVFIGNVKSLHNVHDHASCGPRTTHSAMNEYHISIGWLSVKFINSRVNFISCLVRIVFLPVYGSERAPFLVLYLKTIKKTSSSLLELLPLFEF